MFKYPCPSCGGELEFRSETSVFAVCPYCRSTIVRHDVNVDAIGKMAELPGDVSPLQIGSTGKFNRTSFYVSGRVIYNWVDGTWNEWHLYFDTGVTGWLSEAQGEFALSFRLENPALPTLENLKVGQTISVNNIRYKFMDRKEVSYLGSEGELPFRAEKGYRSTVYDCYNSEGKFLTIEVPNSEKEILVYEGEVVKLSKLQMQNLRLFEGWT